MVSISTHAPLAGRDALVNDIAPFDKIFQPTRPLRGATVLVVSIGIKVFKFQPTRPLRGATGCGSPARS